MDVIIAEKPTIAYIIASALGADKKEGGFVTGNGHMRDSDMGLRRMQLSSIRC